MKTRFIRMMFKITAPRLLMISNSCVGASISKSFSLHLILSNCQSRTWTLAATWSNPILISS